MREPAAGLGGREQFRQRSINGGRLLAGDGVTGTRDHQQSSRRHRAFEKQTSLETRVVFIADNDEKRYGKSA